MAKSLAMTFIHFLVVLSIAAMVRSSKDHDRLKETKMTVYFQEFSGGPNANFFAVAGIPGRPRNLNEFGTTFVADVPITQDISLNSPAVGRAQGILAIASRNGTNAYASFSIVFTNQKYNGSTLEIQGSNMLLATVRELSVISGSKKFRFATIARGYSLFERVLERPSLNYTVVRVSITIRQ